MTPVYRCPPLHPYSCFATSALTFPSLIVAFLLLLFSVQEKLFTAGRGAASRIGPDVRTCERGWGGGGGGGGVVRTQTPAQTITVTSADCVCATKAAVN